MMRALALFCMIMVITFDITAEGFFTHLNPVSECYCKDVLKRRGFEYLGGGGGGCHEFRRASLMFECGLSPKIKEARIIIVEEALRLQTMLNSSRKLRPYMHSFPAGPQNLEYSIGFRSQRSSSTNDPLVDMLHLQDGQIVYVSTNTTPSKALLKESFEEALEKLRADGWKN